MILYYGSEINGLIVSVTEFLTYFKMLEAGLAASVNVALYEPLARAIIRPSAGSRRRRACFTTRPAGCLRG